MLDGEYGEAKELAMKLLVKLGDAYNAEAMIPIASVHLVSCVYNVVYDAGIEIATRFLNAGARFVVPATLCTGSSPIREPENFGVPSDWIKKQRILGETYRELGGIPSWSCIPYWQLNVPRFGQDVAWCESNCVAYANSVLGARTNRYASYIDLCAAVVGRIPKMGLHIPENRRGQVLVRIRGFRKLGSMEYGLLGYLIGSSIVDRIPVIDGIPKRVSKYDLRILGAAAASSGAIALYHVVGVTPEAPTLKQAFGDNRPEDKLTIEPGDLKDALEELRTADEDKVDLVALGCPQYDIGQLKSVIHMMEGKHVKDGVEFWIFVDAVTAYLADTMGYTEWLKKRGIKLMVGACAMNGPTFLRGFRTIVTDSPKLAHYAPMQARAGAYYTLTSKCIEAAITGKLPR